MTNKKKPQKPEMFADPTVPDENDPDFREEMFSLYKYSGMTVEEVGKDDPEEGRLYAEWLKKEEQEGK